MKALIGRRDQKWQPQQRKKKQTVEMRTTASTTYMTLKTTPSRIDGWESPRRLHLKTDASVSLFFSSAFFNDHVFFAICVDWLSLGVSGIVFVAGVLDWCGVSLFVYIIEGENTMRFKVVSQHTCSCSSFFLFWSLFYSRAFIPLSLHKTMRFHHSQLLELINDWNLNLLRTMACFHV